MMKKILFMCCLLAGALHGRAQQFATLSEYRYSNAWTLHKGDTLRLVRPGGAFFKSVGNAMPVLAGKEVLAAANGGAVVISSLEKYISVVGTRQTVAGIRIGGKKYYIDIDRAVYENEILLPQGVSKNMDYTPLSPQEILTRKIDSITLVDSKIVYDRVIEAPGMSAEELFTALGNVFTGNYTDRKYMLSLADPGSGRITGKAFSAYSGSKRHTAANGRLAFVISIAVKEGKFRYQLYDFTAQGVQSKTDVFYKEVQRQEEEFPFEAALSAYRDPKKKSYDLSRQYLADMIAAVEQFDRAVRKAASHDGNIANF